MAEQSQAGVPGSAPVQNAEDTQHKGKKDKAAVDKFAELEKAVAKLAEAISPAQMNKFAQTMIDEAVKAAEKKAARVAIKAADRAARRAVQTVFHNADMLVWEGMKQGATNLFTAPYDATVSALNWLMGTEPKKRKQAKA
jgi:hypothetical protein